jgi:hypothetical protein
MEMNNRGPEAAYQLQRSDQALGPWQDEQPKMVSDDFLDKAITVLIYPCPLRTITNEIVSVITRWRFALDPKRQGTT